MLKNGIGKSINLVYLWKVGNEFSANPIKVKSLQVLSKLALDDFGGKALYAASTANVSQERLIEALLKQEQQKSE